MATTGDRPRFRQDNLIAEAIDDNNTRFIDVLDPESGTLFRFYETEYALACAMDGQRDVAGIVRWAEEELGIKPNPKEVRNVIATLGDLGFIDGAAAPAVAARPEAAPTRPTPPPTPAVSRAPTPPAVSQPQGAKGSSRWDQPTAMGDADRYLSKGVVAGGKQPATPAPEVELGGAGARAAKAAEMPRAPELELGKPGTAAQPARAAGRGEDIALGAPGRVESDLAADMPMSRDDVKEAVRQSQVHKVAEPAPEPAPEPRAAPVAEAPRPVEKRPEPKPAPRPEPRAPVESRPEPARSGMSPVLLAAIVLLVLGLGGFAVYKLVFAKKKEANSVTNVQPTPEPPKPEPPKPTPPVETAKLAVEQPAAEELKAPAPGTIQTIVANDTMVKEGEPIAKLAGFRGPENQVTQTQKQLAKAKTDLEAAQKAKEAAQTANDKNALTAAEKKVATAEKAITDGDAKLATQQAALDKLLIKAPGPGKVTAVAKANAKVTPTDVVATIQRDPTLVAMFKSAPSTPVGTRVLVANKDQKLSCTVVGVEGGVKVACPKDGAPEGTEVTFAGVDPSPPPEAPKPETPTEAPKGEAPKGEAPKGEAPKGEAPPKGEQKAQGPKRPRSPAEKTEKTEKKGSGAPAGGEKPAGGGEPAGSGTAQ